jgi:hypothetical protein
VVTAWLFRDAYITLSRDVDSGRNICGVFDVVKDAAGFGRIDDKGGFCRIARFPRWVAAVFKGKVDEEREPVPSWNDFNEEVVNAVSNACCRAEFDNIST